MTERFMIEGVDHFALSVNDLDRSLGFYRDLLGFKIVCILECSLESRLGEVAGMPGCTARIAHLKTGTTMLELFEYKNPRGRHISTDHVQADHGWIHIGLRSSDVRSDYARLKALGVSFINEPIEFRPGVWIVYFYGPEGEVCELRETHQEPKEKG